MSVKKGLGSRGGTDPALKASVEALQAGAERQEAATALFSLAFCAQVKADRKAGAGTVPDALILQSAEVVDYPAWSAGAAYEKGDIIKGAGGLLFEVVADHTANAAYPLETTFAYYRLIELAHTGTADDPIPYPETAGIVVNVQNGKYYSYKGKAYQAKADMPNCVYPPDTAGLWQWEAVK
jgi:hypothetical protein